MIIANGILTRQSLAGEVVIVTGGGHGIGYEAARALVWLGAQVVIAEIDKKAGKEAAATLNRELGQNNITLEPPGVKTPIPGCAAVSWKNGPIPVRSPIWSPLLLIMTKRIYGERYWRRWICLPGWNEKRP